LESSALAKNAEIFAATRRVAVAQARQASAGAAEYTFGWQRACGLVMRAVSTYRYPGGVFNNSL